MDELISALMEHICQSVMLAGMIVMPRWCVMTFMAVITVSHDNLSSICLILMQVELMIMHTVGEVHPSFHLFPSSSYFAQEVMCNGTEEYSLTQCGYNPSTSPECFVGNHSAAVVCRQGIP